MMLRGWEKCLRARSFNEMDNIAASGVSQVCITETVAVIRHNKILRVVLRPSMALSSRYNAAAAKAEDKDARQNLAVAQVDVVVAARVRRLSALKTVLSIARIHGVKAIGRRVSFAIGRLAALLK